MVNQIIKKRKRVGLENVGLYKEADGLYVLPELLVCNITFKYIVEMSVKCVRKCK